MCRYPGLPRAPGEDTRIQTLCSQQSTSANDVRPFQVEAGTSEVPALCSPSAWKDRPRRQDGVSQTPESPRGGESSIRGTSRQERALEPTASGRRGRELLEVGFLGAHQIIERVFIQWGCECIKRLWVTEVKGCLQKDCRCAGLAGSLGNGVGTVFGAGRQDLLRILSGRCS